MLPRSNPFATRFTRPGAIPPLDPDGGAACVDALLVRLRHLGGVAAIVGPHGSGKSTLLTRLADAVESGAGTAVRLRSRGRRDLGRVLAALAGARAGSVILLDGWETAGGLVRPVLRGIARLRRLSLVVTAHDAADLPVLIRCRTSVELLGRIVDSLPGHREWYGRLIRPADVAEAFAAHGGDVREALFALYDRYEHRLREAGRDGRDDREEGADRAGATDEIQEIVAGFSCPGASGRNLR